MRKRNKIIIIVFLVILLIIITFSIIMNKIENDMRTLLDEEIIDINLSSFDDGIYIGEHTVLPISVKVEVGVNNSKITDIKIVRHLNGQGNEAENIIDAIIKEQNIKVDTISGATYSSIVIIKAVRNALNDETTKQ